MTTNTTGYSMTEVDIEATLKYLRSTENLEATREDAIAYLNNTNHWLTKWRTRL